ncbi:MAG TPA: ATP-binding protein [Planktothrix sp.]|jgi:ATP-dependent DNA helicase RecG
MTRSGFNQRKLMELSIEVMNRSVQETREDGKASPAVGAVLYMPDGTTETAYRGELRDGDHAEFTLLERKKRDVKLDGSVLFATLEPCAPGARAHTKLPCAERIVLARIKEVWVGIEDPDPKVDGKGISYLQQNGVKVHLFDPDLQDMIRNANERFISDALERAERATKKAEQISLSAFEQTEPMAAIADFSNEALQGFRSAANIPDQVGSDSFNRRLLQLGLLKEEGGKLTPTGYGILLFANAPRDLLPQAGLLATVHYQNGDIEKQDFDGPMVLIPEHVEEWLKSRLPNVLTRTGMKRTEQPVIPFQLLREPIINAMVHRDYEIKGAKCQLIISPDKIQVMSPGAPPLPITLGQMKSFTAPTLSRNPQLHYVFSQMGLAEERGLGMKTLKSLPQSLGLPVPKYSFHDPYLMLYLFSNAESVAATVEPSALESLNDDEKTGWQYLTSRMITTGPEYAEALGYDERKTQRQFKKFIDLGLIRRIGQGRASRYEVITR